MPDQWVEPSGSGGAPVPNNGKPMALVSAVDAIPTRIEYSTADTVCTAAACDAYVAARTAANVTRHVSSASADHGDGTLAGVDITACINFLHSVGG